MKGDALSYRQRKHFHDFDVDTVHYLGLLKSVLGAVDTENYTYGELFNEVNARTGGIAYGIEVFR